MNNSGTISFANRVEQVIEAATRLAQAGRFAEMLAACQPLLDNPQASLASLLDVGALFANFGFLSDVAGVNESMQLDLQAELTALAAESIVLSQSLSAASTRVCQRLPVARKDCTTAGDRRTVMRSFVTAALGRPRNLACKAAGNSQIQKSALARRRQKSKPPPQRGRCYRGQTG